MRERERERSEDSEIVFVAQDPAFLNPCVHETLSLFVFLLTVICVGVDHMCLGES